MDPNADTTVGQRPWPDTIAEMLLDTAGAPAGDNWATVGSNRWSTGPVAVVRLATPALCRRQVALLEHLAHVEFPAASVVGSADEWLVTTQPPGISAGSPDHHPDPDDLVGAIGSGLRLLHEVDPSILSADGSGADPGRRQGWSEVADRCRQAVESGRVDPALLPRPYDRYRSEQLLDMLVEGRPADEDVVLCHGGAAMGRFLVDNGTFRGFDFLDSVLVADPHLDLASLHLDLQRLMGPESVFRLYEAYGTDPNLVRLDHYLLATHLLNSVDGSAVDGQ